MDTVNTEDPTAGKTNSPIKMFGHPCPTHFEEQRSSASSPSLDEDRFRLLQQLCSLREKRNVTIVYLDDMCMLDDVPDV